EDGRHRHHRTGRCRVWADLRRRAERPAARSATRARRLRTRRDLNRDPGPEQAPGASPDRRRELRAAGHAAAGGRAGGRHERQREQLATVLGSRLIERRRAEAARGAKPAEPLEAEVRALVDSEAALLAAADRDAVVAGILRDTVGLGPLEDLLADPAVE